ncbi:MAG: efflux RND transporter permease subunit [Bacteroidota bacterium]
MSLSSLSLKRPILATVMSIIIVLFGLIGFNFLGVREYPSVDPPIITVRTAYTGANADVIESQITEPLEKAINGIEGIRTISSSSNQGSSVISVEFDLNSDLEAAANDVRDKVSQAQRQLPEDIDAPPIVSKADANSDAIISMTVKSDTRNQLEVCDYATNVLQERLQTIPGVSGIQIWGEKKYAMRIWFDPMKLAANQLSLNDVQSALNRENIELPSGKIAGNATELTVKTSGLLVTEEDFNNLIIKSDANSIVRLRDVGRAVLGPENEETILKESGVPMVALAIIPQPGSNQVAIADEFYKRFEQLKKEIPEDIEVGIVLDTTKFVKRSIAEVEETLLIAILLVVIIIYLFFRNWLIAIRPLIDIPVSLLGAFFIMYIFGFSINVLTLLGIVLATGLVVDDGIVVTENIYKKLEAGLSPREAAKEGSEEIFFAVISTSITLAVVFLPIIFIQGFVGRLFQEFGIVVAGAVLISAFVSLTLTPVLSVKLAGKPGYQSWFYRKTEPFFRALDNGYRRALGSFMKVKWVSFVIIIACFGLIIFLNKSLPEELAPLEDRGWLRITASTPEGTSYDYMDGYMDRISRFVEDSVPEKQIMLSVTAPGFAGSGAPNTGFGRIVIGDKDTRERSQQQIADYLTKNMVRFNDGRVFVVQDQTISSGGGPRGGLPVQFVLQNSSFNKIKENLPKFMDEVSKSPVFGGMVDVNLKFNRPELGITINRNKAAELGISVADIAQTLQLALSGRRMGYFIMNGKQYQVMGQVERDNRDDPLDMKSFYVRSNTGQLVQLDNLVTVEEQSNPPQLYHYNRYKSATVSAGLAAGKTVGDGIKEMERIADKVLDETFSTSLTGPSRDFKESSSNTLFAFLLALLLVYLILAAQFESFKDPLIIMITVPLALAGALLSLWVFGQTINIFSQIGIIMLIGLVTKNGILIVEFANQLREHNPELSRFEAALQAATMRLRPILMTSLATALGALPIALALGAGAQSRVPLGIVIIGGVMFSLVLTLFVIPVIYTLSARRFLQFIGLKRKAVTTTLLILTCGGLLAQTPMTINEAVEVALKNNYDILLSKTADQAAQLNNTVGNAGMLPNVTLNVSENLSNTNINQKFSNGLEVQSNGVGATNLNANVALDWTLFDGMRMFANKSRLEELQKQTGFNLKEQIQQTVAQVMSEYYGLVGQKMQIKTTEIALDLVKKRQEIIAAKYAVGVVSAFEVNQVNIDKNTFSANLLMQQNNLANLKMGFNILLGRDAGVAFDVTETIDNDTALNFPPVDGSLASKNFSLLSAQRNINISQLQYREIGSQRLPLVRLTSSYGYTRQTSQAGFSLLNQSNGLNAGITASVPLFRSNSIRNQLRTADLQIKSSTLLFEKLQSTVNSAYRQAYNDYQTYKTIAGMEKANAQLAFDNYKIAEGRLQQGLSSLLEVKEAERNWQDAQNRDINARYNLKLAEIELKKLSGQLVGSN